MSALGLWGWSRVPVHEFAALFADKPDAAIIRIGLVDYTAGELRELSVKGQAIDLPHLPPPLWRTEAEHKARRLWDPEGSA